MPFFPGAHGQVFYRFRAVRSGPEGVDRSVASIVLLPGLGQHSGDYHEFARMLVGHGIDVWAIDHVGHGMTEGEPGRVGPLADLVENARLLTAAAAERRARGAGWAEPGPVVLMGHSLGAVVAAETAARAVVREPGTCAGLVLCGVPFLSPGHGRPPRSGGDAADVRARREATEDVRRRFAQGTVVPTLVLHGADDRMVPVDDVRAELGGRDDLRFAIVDGAGHDLPHEPVRREVAAVIADFVHGQCGRGG